MSHSGVIHLGLSDHSMPFAIRKAHRPKCAANHIRTRTYKSFDSELFNNYVKNIHWSVIESCDDIDSVWETWKQLFTQICDEHAPIVDIRVRDQRPKWITDEYIGLSRDRDYFQSKANKLKNSEDFAKAKSLRNKCNNLRHTLIKEQYDEEIKESAKDSKKLWKTLKTTVLPNSSNDHVTALTVVDEETITDP